MSDKVAERVAKFDYSQQIVRAGGEAAEHNWRLLLTHTSAEWMQDLDETTRKDPFQVMHATGLNVHGYVEVREFYRVRMQTFQEQGFVPHRSVVSDEYVVGNGYFSGVPAGVFFGLETHGMTLCLPMTVWIYFEDGLIKGESAYLDGQEIRRQIQYGTNRKPSDPVS